jgi:hypothetical protein
MPPKVQGKPPCRCELILFVRSVSSGMERTHYIMPTLVLRLSLQYVTAELSDVRRHTQSEDCQAALQ